MPYSGKTEFIRVFILITFTSEFAISGEMQLLLLAFAMPLRSKEIKVIVHLA